MRAAVLDDVQKIVRAAAQEKLASMHKAPDQSGYCTHVAVRSKVHDSHLLYMTSSN